MAHHRKRGPKIPFYQRTTYNRAKCFVRLKPCQIKNIVAADVYASYRRRRLNVFITIKFSEIAAPLEAFRQGVKRLSQWHRQWGGDLTWVYVWEATGGYHVHAMAHVPKGAFFDFREALFRSFSPHNVGLKRRKPGPSAMAYLCKGTDWVTHTRLRGASPIRAKAQGHISWARCGVSETIGKSARAQAGFDAPDIQSNYVKTYSQKKHVHEYQQTESDACKQPSESFPTLVVSQSFNSHSKVTTGEAHVAQAPDLTGILQKPCLVPYQRHGP